MPTINDCVNYIYSYQNEIIKIEYMKKFQTEKLFAKLKTILVINKVYYNIVSNTSCSFIWCTQHR